MHCAKLPLSCVVQCRAAFDGIAPLNGWLCVAHVVISLLGWAVGLYMHAEPSEKALRLSVLGYHVGCMPSKLPLSCVFNAGRPSIALWVSCSA